MSDNTFPPSSPPLTPCRDTFPPSVLVYGTLTFPISDRSVRCVYPVNQEDFWEEPTTSVLLRTVSESEFEEFLNSDESYTFRNWSDEVSSWMNDNPPNRP
jgi:hypothetical protein